MVDMDLGVVLRLLLLPLVLLGVMLGGCGHMPVTSMVKLARLDFQTTDPEKLRVAVKLPGMLNARAEGSALRVTVRLAKGEEETQDFSLREVDRSELSSLAEESEVGFHLSAYALAPAEVQRVRMFRAALTQRQKSAGGSGGAITIAVRPEACRTAPLPDGPVRFSTYLKTSETGGFVTLARDVDLRALDPAQDIVAKVPPCR